MNKKNKYKETPTTMGKPAVNIPYNTIADYNQKSTIIQQQGIKITTGPLPDAETLARYKQINPEIVTTILKMAEIEQQKAITQEQHNYKIQRKAINSVNIGRILGSLCFLSIIILAGYAIYIDKEWIANFLVKGILAIGSIFSLGIGYIIYKHK